MTGVNSQLASASHRKYSLSPQRSSAKFISFSCALTDNADLYEAPTLSLILRITLAVLTYIVVHALSTPTFCLWTVSPHRHSCDWSLSRVKVKPSRMSKVTHTHTQSTQADSLRCIPKRISWLGFLVAFWLSPNSACLALVRLSPPTVAWPLRTVQTQGT